MTPGRSHLDSNLLEVIHPCAQYTHGPKRVHRPQNIICTMFSLPFSCQDQISLNIVIKRQFLRVKQLLKKRRGKKHLSHIDIEEKWKKAKTTKSLFHNYIAKLANISQSTFLDTANPHQPIWAPISHPVPCSSHHPSSLTLISSQQVIFLKLIYDGKGTRE